MKRLSLYLLLTLIHTLQATLGAQALSFSPAGGVYSNTFSVTLQGLEGFSIHYTFNGNTPTANDATYTAPIQLTEVCYSQSNIFQIPNCPQNLWVARDEVEHIIVLRAALFSPNGTRVSEVYTEVYIINDLLDREIKIPVVSLCVDSTDLFDYDSGIFIPGVFFDPNNLYFSGNYCQRGREWERLANFTYIDGNTTAVNQSCGIRIHGNRTRSYQQKGFTLYARKEYGNKQFQYPFFGNGALQSYKRLVLRPWSAGWNDTGIPDYLCQQLARPLRCDHLLTRPVALFLNGEYWGIYFLQEKPDEHYVEEHYKIDKDDVDLLSDWGTEVENGSGDSWQSFFQWIEHADLTHESDYQYAAQHIDIEALIDYMLLQVFVSNIDWPANNVRQWSAKGSPWRWFFFDGDASLAIWNYNQVILEQLTCDDPAQSYPSSARATLVFRRLLENMHFRLHAIDRFYKIVHHYIGEDHAIPILQDIRTELSDEVKYQSLRFDNPTSQKTWLRTVNDMERYLHERTTSMPDDFARHLGIDPENVSVSLFPNPSTSSNATLLYTSPYGGILTVEVFNTLGKRLFNHTFDLHLGPNALSLPHLPSGIYLVRTSAKNKPFHWIIR